MTTVVDLKKTGVKKAAAAAAYVLSRGGLVVYPTETAYGIGCDATNRSAVKKIYSAKKRQSKKPLSVIFGSLGIAEKYVFLDSIGLALVRRFMPGPLTLVVKPKKRLSGSPEGEIAFRIPSGKFALELAKRLGKPVTATSANVSGEKPVYSFGEALRIFNGKAGMIIDAGVLPKRKVSTIFDVKNMAVVREGAVNGRKIRKFIMREMQ